MIDLDALEAAAREASPGPWTGTTIGTKSQRDAAGSVYEAVMARRLPDNPDLEFTDMSWVQVAAGDDYLNVALVGNGAKGPENAAYIAAADPATVLALIERIRELEKALEPFVQSADGRTPGWHGDRGVYTLQINQATVEVARAVLRQTRAALRQEKG